MAAAACRSIATATEFQTVTSFRERTIIQPQTQLVFDPSGVGITTVLSINRAGNTVSVRSRITGVTVTTVDRVTTVSTSTILFSTPITTLYAPCTATTTPAIAATTSSTTVATTPSTTASTTPATTAVPTTVSSTTISSPTVPSTTAPSTTVPTTTVLSTTAPPSTITVVSTIPLSSSTSASSTTSVARGGQASNASSKPNTGAIAGGVVGGVVALVALAALLWFCCCGGSKRNKKHESFDFGHNDAWDPVDGVAAAGTGGRGGLIASRNTRQNRGSATHRASSYSRRSMGFNYGDDDDLDDSAGIGRRGTAVAPAMASVGAVGAGLGATYAARQQSQKRKKVTPADEQDAYYSSLPPPRDGSITPSSMSSAGGFGMAGVGVSRYSQYGPQDVRAQHELYNGHETETMRPDNSGYAGTNRMQQAPYNGAGGSQRHSMGGDPQGYGAVSTVSPPRQMNGRGPQQNLSQRVPQARQPQEQRFPNSIAYNAPGASSSPALSHQSLPGLAGGWNGIGDNDRRRGALRVMNEEPEMTEEERRFGGQPDAYNGLTDGLDRVASPGRVQTYRS